MAPFPETNLASDATLLQDKKGGHTWKKIDNETKNDGALSDAELDAVSGGDRSPKETVTFEYGGLAIKLQPTVTAVTSRDQVKSSI